MAVIDKQVYKLNIYDNKLCNNLYKCADDVKYCRAMQKKLVFYDRDQVLSMHAKALSEKNVVYDINSLTPLEFLQENEDVERIVPLDRHWLGVFFRDKVSGKLKEDRMMYVSSEGEGYICDEILPALNCCVAKSVYLKHIEDNPAIYTRLHDKYFDGTHDEFLSEFFGKARNVITDFFVNIIKDSSTKIENKDFQLKEDITLEDIKTAIGIEFRRKPRASDFNLYQTLDMLYAFFNCDKVISLSNQYCSGGDLDKNNQNEKQ